LTREENIPPLLTTRPAGAHGGAANPLGVIARERSEHPIYHNFTKLCLRAQQSRFSLKEAGVKN
ncbi:hypothetical protein CE195_01080, partial [Sodalis-like symbiont of Philaenus spumarius]